MKKKSIMITIKVKKRTGHIPRPSGAGVHEDRRTKRNRTRQKQNQKVLQEFE